MTRQIGTIIIFALLFFFLGMLIKAHAECRPVMLCDPENGNCKTLLICDEGGTDG